MIKNIIRVLSSNIATTVLGVISSLLFPKIMEVNEYASYQTFILYLSYITILHLGLPTGMFIKYGGKTFASIDKAKYVGEMRLLLLILSGFSLIFIVGGIVFRNIILVLIGISTLPYDYVKSYLVLLQAWGDFKTYSILNFSILAIICFAAGTIYVCTGLLTGTAYIYIYMLVYITIFGRLLYELLSLSRGVEINNSLITKDNLDTIKLGFTICVGSYIGILFHSVDKQFVKLFFEDTQFAMYSFAMSMQTIMTVLITSISQPMYYKLAASGMSGSDYKIIRELLMIFGTLSSCAYYVCSIMVNAFIPKYVESISIISSFFAIFPAMAVINCLYVNLYKSRKMTKKYVRSLILMLIIAIVLDAIVIALNLDYIYLAVSTVFAYYIWLVLGSFDFPELKLYAKDYIFIISYFIIYLLIVKVNPFNEIFGFLCGVIACIILSVLFYQNSVLRAIERLTKI